MRKPTYLQLPLRTLDVALSDYARNTFEREARVGHHLPERRVIVCRLFAYLGREKRITTINLARRAS